MILIISSAGFMALTILGMPQEVFAQVPLVLPKLQLGFSQPGSTGEVATGLQILALLTVLTMAPSIIVMMTSFSRIDIVLAFMRQALGTQQSPPNQVLIGMAMFLTLFAMAPVGTRINNEALQPYLAERIDFGTAAQKRNGRSSSTRSSSQSVSTRLEQPRVDRTSSPEANANASRLPERLCWIQHSSSATNRSPH